MLEEIDDGKIGSRRPIGHRSACENSPRPEAHRTGELVDEPRLADTGLPQHSHDLAMASLDLCQTIPEDLKLRVPADEAAQHPPAEPEASRLPARDRSEEHTSELQSLAYLVCRLLLEKKKKNKAQNPIRRRHAVPDELKHQPRNNE